MRSALFGICIYSQETSARLISSDGTEFNSLESCDIQKKIYGE